MIPAGFFVLRTPTLPWIEIERWSNEVSAARTFEEGGDVQAALQKDRVILRYRLREIVRRNAVRGALYVASPSLCERLEQWLDDGTERAQKVEPVVVRYFMRMAGRATPFGLFAGTSVGAIGQHTNLGVPPRSEHVRYTRLDLGYVFSLAEELSHLPTLRPQLRFRATTAAYDVGGLLRYYEPRVAGPSRSYYLVDVDPTPHLQLVLRLAQREDGVTMAEAAAAICESGGDFELSEALDFVHEIVEAKLLRPIFSPALTGQDPVEGLIEQLARMPRGKAVAEALLETSEEIARIDAAGFDAQPGQYEGISRRLRSLATNVDRSRLFRVDLRKPCAALVLGTTVVEDLAKGVELLAGISFRQEESGESAMSAFARDFEFRYGLCEVPLLQALDEETGIGFDQRPGAPGDASPLLDGLAFHELSRPGVRWSGRDDLMLHMLAEALQAGAFEITLTHEDVRALSAPTSPALPPGLGVLASIAAPSSDALDRSQYRIYIRKCIGSTSARLFGRFCHGDPELESYVRAAIAKEEACDPGALHAEIVYLPHGRAANVVGRPVLRDYEIPLFDKSGAPSDRQIDFSDLFVSVRRGHVLLRSRKHGRRVVPHLACAHAFRSSGVGIYRFLASLDQQGVLSDFAFSWGPLAEAPFLPRLRHGRFVLSLARWRIPGHALKAIDALSGAAGFTALQELRARLKLPRFVWLEDRDQCIPLDFDNPLSLEAFLKAAKHLPAVTLSEVFPPPGELIAQGEEGGFHHELVVPLIREAIGADSPPRTEVMPALPSWSGRERRLGDDWLYLKVYCGSAGLDRLLSNVVAPLVRELQADGAIDRWFFVRHTDPKLHLRLRFKGEPKCLWREVAPRLFAAMRAAQSLVHHAVIETYEPEEERYGGEEGLDLSEQLFEADSEAAVAVISTYGSDAEARWRLALLGMDAMLEDFGFALEQKRQIMRTCRSAQLAHYRKGNRLNRRLGSKYRRLCLEIETILETPPLLYLRGVEAIRARSCRIAELVERLRVLESKGCLLCRLPVLAESYLHMGANRIFRNSINAQELVLYEFLYRVYDGRISRVPAGF